jgi:hypothetical protein
MTCPDCGAETVLVPVPDAVTDAVGAPTVRMCTRCLSMDPAEGTVDTPPNLSQISEAFPEEHDAAVPMAVLVGLLDSLALHRAAITTLYEQVERAGVDPLLVLDRLARDETIETEIDLAGRRRHLEQLI